MDKHDKDERLSIALKYDGTNAPTISAKGRGDLADQIRQIAEDSGVPIHEDAVLAYVLGQIDLGEEIPDTLYRVVAEVLAFAYMVAGRVPENFRPPALIHETDSDT